MSGAQWMRWTWIIEANLIIDARLRHEVIIGYDEAMVSMIYSNCQIQIRSVSVLERIGLREKRKREEHYTQLTCIEIISRIFRSSYLPTYPIRRRTGW